MICGGYVSLFKLTLNADWFSFFFASRPESNFKQSHSSLISQPSSSFSDDDLSLGEYGDPMAEKFTEDGSFIGNYATKTNRNSSTLNNRSNSHNNTIV